MRYLQLLAHSFPTIPRVTTEIINLEAILHLPKPTEHFMADLHGEDEAFHHVLRNASGNIKRKVNELFDNTLRESAKKDLCTLIYYPEERLEIARREEIDLDDYYQTVLNQLITVCRNVSSKYTRSKVRKCLPSEYSYIIEELLHESSEDHNKQAYFNVIIKTIIDTHRADHFIICLSYLIQRLAIDRLHILGDIYDRGPGAHLIMDTLCDYHHLDIQWGNHDILWMGAAAGNLCCVAGVLRLSLRYANTRTLEEGYGINMVPLATFAMETYGNDPCTLFLPHTEASMQGDDEKERRLISQMHKAIAILQFKLEGQLYHQHPEWQMDDRALLEHLHLDKGTITIDGTDYPLLDTNFPTIDPNDPYATGRERPYPPPATLVRHQRTAQAPRGYAAPPWWYVRHLQFQPALPRLGAHDRRRSPARSHRGRPPLQRARTPGLRRATGAHGLRQRRKQAVAAGCMRLLLVSLVRRRLSPL